MEKFVKGDVVVIPFPFSDMSSSKRRPGLVMASGEDDDVILCQITSNTSRDQDSIVLEEKDFARGKLSVQSLARPRKLFTADKSVIEYKVGSLRDSKMKEITDKLCALLRSYSR